MTATMATAALKYLDSRWPVFPVCSPASPGHCFEHPPGRHPSDEIGKHPLVRWSLFQDQLPTVDNVRDWWRRWPRANIGLATGALSGIALIDLDGLTARQEAGRRGLDPGPTVATGRVGGQHRYCAWRPDAPTVFARSNGIDLRAQGGYVLLPPSRHRNGPRYTWLLTPEQVSLPPLPRWIDDLANESRHCGSQPVTDDIIPEHQRNATLTSMAGTMRRRGFGEPAILAEGEFDALLLWQEAGDLIGVATLGSCNRGVSAKALRYLLGCPRLLVAYDVDTEGEKGAERLGQLSPRMHRVRPPAGKDVTAFWQAGGRVRDRVRLELARLCAVPGG